jgi:hypothetical protein
MIFGFLHGTFDSELKSAPRMQKATFNGMAGMPLNAAKVEQNWKGRER